MRRRSLVGFVILNIVVTFVVALGIIYAYNRLAPAPTPPKVPPLQVIITATSGPEETRVVYVVVTATPGGAAPVPLNLTLNPTDEALATLGLIPTLDPSLLPPVLPSPLSGAAGTGTPASEGGCQKYTVKAGDTPGGIATAFGVTLAELYRANGMKPDPILQIGQILVIPLNGCGLSTDTPTPTATNPATVTPQPTSTLAPTAARTTVQIVQVIKPGDITEEGVDLLNISTGVVDLTGWILHNSTGDTFTFPTYRMFPNTRVTVLTRTGSSTARLLYWGLSSALWGKPGETITLSDSKGVIQAGYVIGDSSGGSGGATATPPTT